MAIKYEVFEVCYEFPYGERRYSALFSTRSFAYEYALTLIEKLIMDYKPCFRLDRDSVVFRDLSDRWLDKKMYRASFHIENDEYVVLRGRRIDETPPAICNFDEIIIESLK